MDPDAPLIRFRRVAFHYDPARPVFDALDFELRPGERLGLVGANGSGKTTLLHLVVGLLRPASGEVEVFGRPRRAEKDFHDVRARIGLLFQDPEDQLFCPTVEEDVAFGPLNLGKGPQEALAIVHRTLAALGLEGFGERATYRLSFGEKKLVALAGVLAMDPEVLLLDEPTGGLDEDHGARLIGILKDLARPMIVVSHDAALLDQTTTRRARLARGIIDDLPAGPATPR